MAIDMSNQGMTIAQAAKALAVSSRTVRRYIKSGRIQASLVAGPFGDEYRIAALPPELEKTVPVDSTPVQTPVQTPVKVLEMVSDLQEKNMVLAARLGAATERINNLESQIKLLAAGRRPWWRRFFSGGS
ncbi:MAG: helix-turn-helix domain-containing protein [Dehalococcoidales bacterium]